MKKTTLLFPVLFLLGTGASMAQYKILHSFNDTAGGNPEGTLTLSGSLLYGMADGGGANGYGCIFSIDTNGSKYNDLYDFNGTNGAYPLEGSLVLSGVKLYGMVVAGGANDSGCIFSIDTNGKAYKDMLDFNGTNGSAPQSSLTLSGSQLFGMTYAGGLNHLGCVFSIDTNGSFYKDLLDFNGTNGQQPYGNITILKNKLYGMASYGGANGDGNIFLIDSNGTGFKDLVDFDGTSNPIGQYPNNILTYTGTQFFGMTYSGGAALYGNVFSVDTNGSLFKDLFDFEGTAGPFGAYPYGDVILSGSNVLYGMTLMGGANDSGCIFSVDTNGNGYNDIFDFNGTNGKTPLGDVTISGHTLYGVTDSGGANRYGVIFSYKLLGTGINNLAKTSQTVSLYPNPNNGKFTLQIRNYTPQIAGSNIEIYNMLGQTVYSSTITQSISQLSIPATVQGVYLYRLIDKGGNIIGEGKFVVE